MKVFPTAARDQEALRLAKAMMASWDREMSETQVVSLLQVAILDGMEWQASGGRAEADQSPVSEAWPTGCFKRSSCARHRQCMYGRLGTCPHVDTVIEVSP